MDELRQHWENRYQSANLPWDSKITPPEVVDFWQSGLSQSLPTMARTLDIGSGTGTNIAFLSQLGHLATGVELSQFAINIAAARHQSLPPRQRQRISMIQGSAASIPFNQSNFHYALDIGCLHGIPATGRQGYAAGVVNNLLPGGFYHLYGFDKVDKVAESASSNSHSAFNDTTAQRLINLDRGLGPTEVVDLLGAQMEIIDIQQANPNPTPCRWYLFKKR